MRFSVKFFAIINVFCEKCEHLILVYQKDRTGRIKRCYLNRIVSQASFAALQKQVKDHYKLGNLVCNYGSVIGFPMKYKDGRLAFRLIRGKYKRY